MKDLLNRHLPEAIRLTRSGRLADATAVLQRALRGKARETVEIRGTERSTPAPKPPGFLEGTDHIGAGPTFWTRRPRPSPTQPLDIVAENAQWLAKSYGNAAGRRDYKLYVPGGYHGQAVPLIVMLHGCTQSPDDFAAGTRMNRLGEESTCLVAYPAQAASANRSKCWNWFSPRDQQRGQGEPSLIAGITGEIIADYSVDRRRVYVAGLSAGGAQAAIMGMVYPDLYAAIGVHSGLACGAAHDLPSALAAMRQGEVARSLRPRGATGSDALRSLVPIIVFHGDRDTTVNPSNGDQVVAQSIAVAAVEARKTVQQGQAAGGRGYRRTSYADASGRTIIEHWLVNGAGHAWSGGSAAGSYTDPLGPDASREMLRFFLEHPSRHADIAQTR